MRSEIDSAVPTITESKNTLTYYAKNKERYNANSKRWWNNHRDKLRAKWRRRNASPVGRAKAKRHRIKYAAQIKAKKQAHQKANRAYYNQYHKQWRMRNIEHVRAKARLYARSHPPKRRALIKAATKNLGLIRRWMNSVIENSTAVCYWCQKRIPRSMIHFDHIVALAKGGSHSVENLCVSCSSCNLEKHDKEVSNWIKSGQQFLSL